MGYITLELPPGVYRNGTRLQSGGRYYDSNLVRWFSGEMRPVGGWGARSIDPVTGKARAILAWSDNGNTTWIGIGTESHLYAMDRGGVLSDITPDGFTPGNADATTVGGYGGGLYGAGDYGTPRPDTEDITPASMWTLDTWGEDLVGVMAEDGKIYEWALEVMTPAAVVENAPTATALVVTEERFMFALGADGNPRKIAWCDQENDTVWEALATNQAGDFNLQTPGRLMCAKRLRGSTLIFTDVDVHQATYQGPPFVYGFQRMGSGCGIISRQAVAVADGRAVWMSQNGFWTFDGSVAPLQCDVSDYVFSGLNTTQASKIYAVHNSSFGEVWWFYPSASSNEIDSYVVWNYRENHWAIGKLVRLSGVDRGVLNYPIMVGPDGLIYEHETGTSHDDDDVYAEGGPIQLGLGDDVMMARELVPDQLTLGPITATLKVRFYPNGPEVDVGPYTLDAKTDVRLTGREISLRWDAQSNSDWRIGAPRLEVVSGGRR